MAQEDIKIVVRQETQGSALKDATRDAEKLKQADSNSAAQAEKRATAEERITKAKKEQAQYAPRPEPVIRDHATQPRGTSSSTEPRSVAVNYDAVRAQSNDAAAFMTAEEKRIKAASNNGEPDERTLTKQAAYTTLIEAKQARASGDTVGAEKLEREAEVLNRSLQIQRNLNVSMVEARVLASQQVDAEHEIAAQKQAQNEATKRQRADAAAVRAEARARVSEEQKITQEQREQDKLHSRQRAEALRGGRIVLNAGANAAGASGFGVLSSALGGASVGPAGIAAAIGTAIASTVGTILSQELSKMDAAAASEGKAVESANRRKIIAGKTGAEAQEEASSNRLATKQALEAAEAKRGSFRDSGFGDIAKRAYNWASDKGLLGFVPQIATKFGYGLETSSQAEERKNNLDIERYKKDLEESDKQAAQKFSEGPGGLELEMRRRLIARDRQGALAIQDRITAQKEYARVLHESGSELIANQASEDKVFLDRRARAGEFGRLVSARSGAADIAQAASLASEVLPLRDIRSSIDAMHASIRGQHAEAQQARNMTRFR